MILSGQTIRRLNVVTPFSERAISHGMTHGVGPAGYDVRVEFGWPKFLILPAGGFALASTVERFAIPNDVLATVHDKSSWARRGLAVQNTVFEPGWRGYATLELTNHSNVDLTILAGMPIAQVIFWRVDEPVEAPYDGKYQDQKRGPQESI